MSGGQTVSPRVICRGQPVANHPYIISIKLYGPDGKKIEHKEVKLPAGLKLEDALKVFKDVVEYTDE